MIKKKVLVFISIIFIFSSLSVLITPAFDYSGSFEKANELYERGDFSGAMEGYEQILKEGAADAALYYNMGNACFKKDMLGRAILYYEKALILSPRDRDIRQNLEYVRSLTADKQYSNGEGIIHFFLSGMKGFLSLNELTVMVILLYFFLFLLAFIFIFTDSKALKFYIKLSGFFLLLLFVLSIFFLSSRIYNMEYNPGAIIMTEQAEARSGPGDNYTEVFTVHEGSLVYLRQNQRDWSQITLPSGYTGWVKSGMIEKI